ncbi:sensor histidine kinase [Desulfovibrio ferrophilus]|uniref:Histidine kinase n=1 Tax=Desulfovibrio ferrophilus TaxID=241368 RepID=A0A2Z6AYF0_9BACT|nr:HAMP domain-containing sensor histidine kinase [Desulfovibrio ferrophilus]BBD08186.1 histidine kinase [Desulfovibrio ferrophilus]
MFRGKETDFLPVDRASTEELNRDVRAVGKAVPAALVDMFPIGIVVINQYRQIVFANSAFKGVAATSGTNEPVGLRPGEALGCVHGCSAESGCGTTRFCRHCGAVLAILESLRGHQAAEECRMVRKGAVGDESLDLQVFTSPLEVEGRRYSLFSALDISHEKRRSAMERIFFHDVLNSASGMYMLSGLMEEGIGPEREEAGALLRQSSSKMLELILSQKDLLAAEQGHLQVCFEDAESRDVLEQVRDKMLRRPEAQDRVLVLSENVSPVAFVSDEKLLGRVLGNLVLNALEAADPIDTVTLDCRTVNGEVEFLVHNEGVMPEDVQLQLFKRSFSTKGQGRGLGLYAARLMGEGYLGGTLSFCSNDATGTVFSLRVPIGHPEMQ